MLAVSEYKLFSAISNGYDSFALAVPREIVSIRDKSPSIEITKIIYTTYILPEKTLYSPFSA